MSPFSAHKSLVYFFTLGLFAANALALNAVSACVAWLPRRTARERFFERIIHRYFRFFVWWFRRAGLVEVEYVGAAVLAEPKQVVVANHPGLMDALYLLARVPAGVCIFKNSVRYNPVFSATVRAAGHLANDGGVGLVRAAVAQLVAGATLVVFPEGTRTPPGKPPARFLPGFALMARKSGAPVQLVRITCDGGVLSKGHRWWRVPPLPMRVTIETGPRLDPLAARSTADLVAQVESWYRATPRVALPDAARTAPAVLPPFESVVSS